MKLVKLDDDVWVNPEHVVAVELWDERTCVMTTYKSHIVELDVYEVLDRLDPPVLGIGPTPPPYVPERIPDEAVYTLGRRRK